MAEKTTSVLELVIEREGVRNALNLATTERLLLALAQARDDPAVRAVLLRGGFGRGRLCPFQPEGRLTSFAPAALASR